MFPHDGDGLVWSYQTKAMVHCNPVVVDGRLLIGSQDRHYHCFESTDAAKAGSR
jgi:outer membrane protein assembly factor BamB